MGKKRFATQARGVSGIPLVAWLLIGAAVGLVTGYIFMGTVHTMMLTRGQSHYQAESGAGTGGGAGAPTGMVKNSLGGLVPAGSIHMLLTSNGNAYQNYQTRILLGTLDLIREMPGGERHVAITRVLHRTKPDDLMSVVETFHATPLQPQCDGWCEYPVSDRANAVRQFFDAAANRPEMIKGEWMYMIESDYVFMKPLDLPRPLPPGVHGWAYEYGYISPRSNKDEMDQLLPGVNVTEIPASGPAPVLLRLDDWIKVTPSWERITAPLEANTPVKKKLGWVREMYAFSLALVDVGVRVELYTKNTSPFISHLPSDDSLLNAHAFHYTLCTIYKTADGNKDVWAFDKRFHTDPKEVLDIPAIPEMPEFVEGKYKFVEGNKVTLAKHNAIKQMIDQMNRAIKAMKPLQAAIEQA